MKNDKKKLLPLKATEPIQGDSLLFTTRSTGVPGIHLNRPR